MKHKGTIWTKPIPPRTGQPAKPRAASKPGTVAIRREASTASRVAPAMIKIGYMPELARNAGHIALCRDEMRKVVAEREMLKTQLLVVEDELASRAMMKLDGVSNIADIARVASAAARRAVLCDRLKDADRCHAGVKARLDLAERLGNVLRSSATPRTPATAALPRPGNRTPASSPQRAAPAKPRPQADMLKVAAAKPVNRPVVTKPNPSSRTPTRAEIDAMPRGTLRATAEVKFALAGGQPEKAKPKPQTAAALRAEIDAMPRNFERAVAETKLAMLFPNAGAGSDKSRRR